MHDFGSTALEHLVQNLFRIIKHHISGDNRLIWKLDNGFSVWLLVLLGPPQAYGVQEGLQSLYAPLLATLRIRFSINIVGCNNFVMLPVQIIECT